jgi:sugar lactone lactonase YvrE
MSADTVDVLVRADDVIGESPLWAPGEQSLYWVDIDGPQIFRLDAGQATPAAFRLPELVTAIGLRRQGGLVITLQNRFAFFDPRTGALDLLDNPEPQQTDNRFNDAKVDRQGRFWAGTINAVHWDAPTGSLYRMTPQRTITRMQGDAICPNGIAWSPDDRTLYFVESFRYAIFAYDFDVATGAIANRHLFASVDHGAGAFPDGLTVDADGCVWCAHNVVGRVVRYTPAGEVDRILQLPVPRATSCAFGGPRLDTLYITTARETMTPGQLARYPLSGSLFAARPGVQGLPEPSFLG